MTPKKTSSLSPAAKRFYRDMASIGLVHKLVMGSALERQTGEVGCLPESYPELKGLANRMLQAVQVIFKAPSLKNFRKGRRPSEKKPFSQEKALAAYLLATKAPDESLHTVVRVWNYLLGMLPKDPLPMKLKKKLIALNVYLARRSKLLRKWRPEPRFKKLMQKFESDHTESLMDEMASIVSRAPVRPLLESARGIYLIGSLVARTESRAQCSFITELYKKYETLLKDDRQTAQALVLAGMYAIKPYALNPLAAKKWSDFVRKEVNLSFSLQRDAVKGLVVERNKKRRAAVASSLDGLMVIREIIVLDGLGMIDLAAYAEKAIGLRRSGREKAKKKK